MNPRTERIGFSALLFGAVGALLAATTRLGPQARLVPLVVAVATFALLGAQLLADVRRTQNGSEAPGPYRLAWLREQVRRAFQPTARDPAAKQPASRELRIFLWIAALPASVWLVGLAPGVTLYTLIYLHKRAEVDWGRTAAVTTVVAAFPWSLARLGIAGRLYEGALWRWIGI